MIILGKPIVLFSINPVVNRYIFFPVRPEEIHEANSIHQSVFVSGVLFFDQFVLSRIPFIKYGIVADEIPGFLFHEIPSMLPKLEGTVRF